MKDLLCILGLLVQLGLSQAGSYCTYNTNYWLSTTEYCEYGCCDEDCCQSDIPAIIGIVVGSVIGGILVVSFIVCLVCVCIKKKGKGGRVISPDAATTQTTTVFTTASAYPHQVYNNPVYYSYPQPPAYGQPSFAPPAYGMVPSAPSNASLTADGSHPGNRLPPLPRALYNDPSSQQQH